MEFDYTPDHKKLSELISYLTEFSNSSRSYSVITYAKGKSYRTKTQRLRPPGFLRPKFQLPPLETLNKVDLDLHERPGNPAIRRWSYIELHLEKRSAWAHTYGNPKDYDFSAFMGCCIRMLGLVPTKNQERDSAIEQISAFLDPELFKYIEGPLRKGNFNAALSSAVIFVEDRLRQKIGPNAKGLNGSDLSAHAYRNPGCLVPPLALANNAIESVHLLFLGWFGYARNLHGHNAHVPVTAAATAAQLSGINYVLWIINQSEARRA